MKPMTSALFAGAVLLLVANMMEADGQVSQMAELEKGDLRTASAAIPEIKGSFTDQNDLGPDANTPVFDVAEDEVERKRRPKPAQPSIAEFGWGEPDGSDSDGLQGKGPQDLQPGEVSDDFNPTLAVRD